MEATGADFNNINIIPDDINVDVENDIDYDMMMEQRMGENDSHSNDSDNMDDNHSHSNHDKNRCNESNDNYDNNQYDEDYKENENDLPGLVDEDHNHNEYGNDYDDDDYNYDDCYVGSSHSQHRRHSQHRHDEPDNYYTDDEDYHDYDDDGEPGDDNMDDDDYDLDDYDSDDSSRNVSHHQRVLNLSRPVSVYSTLSDHLDESSSNSSDNSSSNTSDSSSRTSCRSRSGSSGSSSSSSSSSRRRRRVSDSNSTISSPDDDYQSQPSSESHTSLQTSTTRNTGTNNDGYTNDVSRHSHIVGTSPLRAGSNRTWRSWPSSSSRSTSGRSFYSSEFDGPHSWFRNSSDDRDEFGDDDEVSDNTQNIGGGNNNDDDGDDDQVNNSAYHENFYYSSSGFDYDHDDDDYDDDNDDNHYDANKANTGEYHDDFYDDDEYTRSRHDSSSGGDGGDSSSDRNRSSSNNRNGQASASHRKPIRSRCKSLTKTGTGVTDTTSTTIAADTLNTSNDGNDFKQKSARLQNRTNSRTDRTDVFVHERLYEYERKAHNIGVSVDNYDDVHQETKSPPMSPGPIYAFEDDIDMDKKVHHGNFMHRHRILAGDSTSNNNNDENDSNDIFTGNTVPTSSNKDSSVHSTQRQCDDGDDDDDGDDSATTNRQQFLDLPSFDKPDETKTKTKNEKAAANKGKKSKTTKSASFVKSSHQEQQMQREKQRQEEHNQRKPSSNIDKRSSTKSGPWRSMVTSFLRQRNKSVKNTNNASDTSSSSPPSSSSMSSALGPSSSTSESASSYSSSASSNSSFFSNDSSPSSGNKKNMTGQLTQRKQQGQQRRRQVANKTNRGRSRRQRSRSISTSNNSAGSSSSSSIGQQGRSRRQQQGSPLCLEDGENPHQAVRRRESLRQRRGGGRRPSLLQQQPQLLDEAEEDDETDPHGTQRRSLKTTTSWTSLMKNCTRSCFQSSNNRLQEYHTVQAHTLTSSLCWDFWTWDGPPSTRGTRRYNRTVAYSTEALLSHRQKHNHRRSGQKQYPYHNQPRRTSMALTASRCASCLLLWSLIIWVNVQAFWYTTILYQTNDPENEIILEPSQLEYAAQVQNRHSLKHRQRQRQQFGRPSPPQQLLRGEHGHQSVVDDGTSGRYNFWTTGRDSINERAKKKKNVEEISSDCEYTPWQEMYVPNCNALHELDLSLALHHSFIKQSSSRSGQEQEQNGRAAPMGEHESSSKELQGTYLASGLWRDVWKLTSSNRYNQTAEESIVLKMMKPEHEVDYRNLERHRREAMTMERLTSSNYVVDIYSHCANSILTEYGTGGGLDDYLRKLQIQIAETTDKDGEGSQEMTHGDVTTTTSTSATKQKLQPKGRPSPSAKKRRYPPNRKNPAQLSFLEQKQLHWAWQVSKSLQDLHNLDVIHADLQAKQFMIVINNKGDNGDDLDGMNDTLSPSIPMALQKADITIKLNDFNRCRFVPHLKTKSDDGLFHQNDTETQQKNLNVMMLQQLQQPLQNEEEKVDKQLCPIQIPSAPGIARAPEEYALQDLSPALDVYSLGHVLFQIITMGQVEPWEGVGGNRIKASIGRGEKPRIPIEYYEIFNGHHDNENMGYNSTIAGSGGTATLKTTTTLTTAAGTATATVPRTSITSAATVPSTTDASTTSTSARSTTTALAKLAVLTYLCYEKDPFDRPSAGDLVHEIENLRTNKG